ncbi:MAG: dTDP-4-dehydrorhamnose 3,5-epimerase [Rhizobiaceae bacterium]
MTFEETALPDVFIVTPVVHRDARGSFAETFRGDLFERRFPGVRFIQDNHAVSTATGTVRGLHFQHPPRAQGKLIRCLRGRIADVAVDIRVGSPTFGGHVVVQLSADNWRQLWVPVGFAHGYCTLERDTEVEYKVTDFWSKDHEGAIAFDDTDIGIEWGVSVDRSLLKPGDVAAPRLRDLASPFRHEA